MFHEISKEEAVSLISDEYVTEILDCTDIKPKSAKKISELKDIPLAVCYRRINKLEDLGLLKKDERALTNEGKRVWLYKSNLETAEIIYEEGDVKAFFKLKDGIEEYFGEKERQGRTPTASI